MLKEAMGIRCSAVSLFLLFIFPFNFSNNSSNEVANKQKRTSDRGIYITEYVARTNKLFTSIRERAKKAGFNTLVVDAKRALEDPLLELIKKHQLGPGTKIDADPWLSNLAKELHDEGLILSVRVVVFKDDHLSMIRPDLAVRVKGGGLYRDRKGGRWVDAYSDEVRLFNELIAERAALSGVDEVQFDYIRFPAEGAAKDAYFPFEKKGVSRVDIICSFLDAVRKRIDKYKVSLAVDIFGVTAWQSKTDIINLGQDLKRMGQYIDVISPMFYPSHFHAGYDGFPSPGSQPYYFVNTGIKRTKEILSTEAVAIIPWIQGFNLRSPNYGPEYILEQLKACQDEEIKSYLVWNARNVYDVTFQALTKK
jgi:hypothetical protein